ncbi:MAG: hypothetical protein A2Y40_07790 [Candidatus Margulisbacteria bacterium GWF2_35_9]|nr:MAG: hypothetical protein A2Y40_07790 [Candidatus Margulisbacteria bacterium GWF2_35_9]
MILTEVDIKKVREIVREETADIRQNMLTKKDAENFLTKKDAKILVENASQRTASLVIEKMRDEFRAFYDKLKFTDDNVIRNKNDINENRVQIDIVTGSRR